MTQKELEDTIKRINELYHKSQESGLTDEEKEEQVKLREKYMANFRKNFKSQLANIDVQQPDGTILNLKDAAKLKKKK